jgi:heat shock protein HtpX
VSSPTEPLLPYDRVAENRRWTWIILGVFALLLLPAAAYINELVTGYFAFASLYAGVLTDGGELDPQATILRGRIIGLVVAVGVVALVAWLKFRRAGPAVLKLIGARPADSAERGRFGRIVDNLCIGAGLPAPSLCVIDSFAANACSAGLSPDRAYLAVTGGLLELLERREVEAVLAQELAQIANLDTRLKTIVAALVTTLWLPIRVIAAVFRPLFRLHPLAGCLVVGAIGFPIVMAYGFAITLGLSFIAEEPGFALVFIGLLLLPVYVFVVVPVGGSVIRAALSRELELAADAEAVLLTRNPAALARALVKMSAAGPDPARLRPAAYHLFTLDPNPGRRWLTPTHPTIEQRIGALQRMDATISEQMLLEANAAGSRFRNDQS